MFQRCSSSDGTSTSITVKDTCTCQEPVTGQGMHGHRPSSRQQQSPALASCTRMTSVPSPARVASPGPIIDITQSPRRLRTGKKSPKRPRPKTLEDLLTRLGLQVK